MGKWFGMSLLLPLLHIDLGLQSFQSPTSTHQLIQRTAPGRPEGQAMGPRGCTDYLLLLCVFLL